MRKKISFILGIFILIALINRPVAYGGSLNEGQLAKEEFRGVWVSTVFNLDYPSKRGLSRQELEKEFKEIVENLDRLNMNAIVFQIRPEMDAFYPSKINPWSKYLLGEGKDQLGFDLLKWMIDECHSKGIEFHAWFNPYRVSTESFKGTDKLEDLKKLPKGNWAKDRPESVIKYKDKLYLNPGDKEVRAYVTESIMEVVENYNIDGVHLDDYFYPNTARNQAEKFYDSNEEKFFKADRRGISKLSDWRRDNINRQIKDIKESIDSYNKLNKKDIRFGISPFGIWGHKDLIEGGSNTPISSMSSWDMQFADSLFWIREAYVDYIAPQIYWTFDTKAAPYGELVKWWSEAVRGTDVDLYIGQAAYRKVGATSRSSWSNPSEICNQLKYNSNFEEVKGSIYFRYKSLIEESLTSKAFVEKLMKNHYQDKARCPRRNLSISPEPFKGEELKTFSITQTSRGNIINWYDEENKYQAYKIYRWEIDENGEKGKELIISYPRDRKLLHIDKTIQKGKEYKYSLFGY